MCLTRAGTCTLRAAIQEANALVGRDSIVFDIPGAVPITLQPASPLPGIVRRMTIDATTQPGFAGRPIIHIDGADAGAGANGLSITGPGNLVKGFVISRFSGNGIVVTGSDNTIQGNFIGTNVSGTRTRTFGNARGGVEIVDPGRRGSHGYPVPARAANGLWKHPEPGGSSGAGPTARYWGRAARAWTRMGGRPGATGAGRWISPAAMAPIVTVQQEARFSRSARPGRGPGCPPGRPGAPFTPGSSAIPCPRLDEVAL